MEVLFRFVRFFNFILCAALFLLLRRWFWHFDACSVRYCSENLLLVS